MHDHTPPTASPETWASAHRITQRVWRPLERFLHVEAASGVALLIAAAVALFWANSPWSASYEHLWHTPFTVGVGRFLFTKPLHFLVNDGLMVIFFFVVGLEIRREIHEGELSEPKRAVLPVAAALGGMIAPALLFFALNRAPAVQRGWGVPTATDIAFAVGVLALLGKRVPPALRVLLLALAIIDDIGAILVIAVFYSSGVVWAGLAVAAGAALGVLLMQRLGVRSALVYVIPGVVLWGGMLHAGVHPTIAGVILGLLTPARSWFGESGFVATTREVLRDLRARTGQKGHDTSDLAGSLRQMRVAQREAQSPVVRLQAALHPWVAYGIMPLFALANAGVSLRGLGLADPDTKTIALGIIIGLVLGKPLGILTVSFLSVRLGICALPHGVGWRGVFLVGCVAGIGFTMAIFIAGLAFPDPRLLGAAKLGVLIASALAAVIGLLVGRAVLPRAPAHGAAATLEEAEASAEM